MSLHGGDGIPAPNGQRGSTPLRLAVLRGLLAGGAALFVLLGWRLLSGRPGFLDIVADGVTGYLPVAVFDAGLQAFGAFAKGLLFAGIALGVLAAGVIVATRARRPLTRRGTLVDAAVLAAGVLVLAEAVALPLFRAGLFGSAASGNPVHLHAPLVLASLAYAGVLLALRDGWEPHDRETAAAGVTGGPATDPAERAAGMTRRSFLGSAAALVGAGSLVGSVAAIAVHVLDAAGRGAGAARRAVEFGLYGPTPAVTPVPDFYVVNKDLLPTVVDGSAWRLKVDGLVERPQELSLADLRAMPAQHAHRTLECISFEIVKGDDLIGNQAWRGVRVSDVLERAGLKPGASWVLWEAEDGYAESLPLAVALDPDTWVAYEMGGAPLTAQHGFPARVLIAGRFGMKQPKWLRRLQVSDHDEAGYWEQRGWDPDAFVKTMSRIDFPAPGDVVPAGAPFAVYGIANSGDRAISRVELSADDGATWQRAALEPASVPPLGPLTWVRWRTEVTVPRPGTAVLAVRATDGSGAVQEGAETPPLPSGATGWHRVRVVAEARGGSAAALHG